VKQGRINPAFIFAALLMLPAGCVVVERTSREVEVVEADQRGGPPPWAPAHGWRRKHETYYYYPSSQVYYYPSLRKYYWLEGRDWSYGDRLPRRFVIDEDRKVSLNLDYEPHTQHAKITSSYPRDYYERDNRRGYKW
jgi:hypothetical protein